MFIVIFSGGSQYSLANRHTSSIVAIIGYSVDLDCQMNDPSVNVSLKQEKKNGKDFDRIADGMKVTQSGQIFTINNVEKTDKGKYSCKVGPTSMRIEEVLVMNKQPG